MNYLDESHILLFLVQLFVLLLLTRGLGELFSRWKQPRLTAELLVGIILGPTIMGRFVPALHRALFPPDLLQQNMIETVAWFGVLFLLLDTGMEMDFSVAWRQRGPALTIAFSDIVIPVVIAFIPCLFLPQKYLIDPNQRIIFSLFIATVMTISAMPVSARILHDLNILKADVGFLIMSALAVNDICGWVLFTIVLSLFTQGAFNLSATLKVFLITVGFAALALSVGRSLSTKVLNRLQRFRFPEPATSLTYACLIGLLFGAITQKIGVHALFGFFIAGVVVGEAKTLTQETRTTISQMVHSIFVPLFFANIGLKIDFAVSFDPFIILFISIIGITGRYLGAWIGVRLTRTPQINRNVISISHIPGGMMEIVVAVLALESGLINTTIFIAIVFSAVISSIIVGPWMKYAISRKKTIGVIHYLSKEKIIPSMKAANRDEAVSELVALACPDFTNSARDNMIEQTLIREREFSTSIGEAVAVPHIRMDSVRKPIIVFGRSMSGLEWDASDGKAARYIFFLVTPAGVGDVHLQLLADIARVMREPENRKMIDRVDDPFHLWEILKTCFKKT